MGALADGGPDEVDPGPPEHLRGAAEQIFGDRLDLAIAFAALLMHDGVIRGLIGPREAPRIWDRHLLNCAVVVELIPRDARVLDVGSGAGLPGIVVAVARPDLSVILVEPLARRTAFLTEAVATLGLAGVTVVRARAEELRGQAEPGPVDIVMARAVAPLDRLAAWCLPLAAVGGHVLALKGGSAAEEIAVHGEAVTRLGGSAPAITVCGTTLLPEPTTVVDIVRERDPSGPRRSTRPSRRDRRTREPGPASRFVGRGTVPIEALRRLPVFAGIGRCAGKIDSAGRGGGRSFVDSTAVVWPGVALNDLPDDEPPRPSMWTGPVGTVVGRGRSGRCATIHIGRG